MWNPEWFAHHCTTTKFTKEAGHARRENSNMLHVYVGRRKHGNRDTGLQY